MVVTSCFVITIDKRSIADGWKNEMRLAQSTGAWNGPQKDSCMLDGSGHLKCFLVVNKVTLRFLVFESRPSSKLSSQCFTGWMIQSKCALSLGWTLNWASRLPALVRGR